MNIQLPVANILAKFSMAGVKITKNPEGQLDVSLSYHLPFDLDLSWQAMTDVKSLVEDKYHHDLVWLTDVKQGTRAKFQLRHTQFSRSQVKGGLVKAEIVEWEAHNPEVRRIVLREESENNIFDHLQSFILTKSPKGTVFQYVGHLPQLTVDKYFDGMNPARKLALTVQIAYEVERLIAAKYMHLIKCCKMLEKAKS